MSSALHPPAAGNANLRLARCQVFETACFHTLAHSAAPRPTPNAFPFNHFHTLFVATGYAPALPILELTPPPSIQLSFQQLTQYPFCKSFCLIYIHLMGGVYPPCWLYPSLQNPLNVRGVDFHRRRPRNQVQRQHHAIGVLLPDKASFHPRQRPALDAYPGSNTQIRMRFDPRPVQNPLAKTFDFAVRKR